MLILPVSGTSLVSSDGLDGARPTSASHSFNMYDGKVVMGTGSNVVIGPPTNSYQSQGNTAAVRGMMNVSVPMSVWTFVNPIFMFKLKLYYA